VCNEPAWSLEALAAHSDEKRHLGLCENGTLISVPDHNRQTGSRPTWSKLSLPRQPPARQERLHHLAHAFERREGEQRVAAPRHQAHAHFRIDWQRRLLVAPAEILLGSFERAAALLVGLQPDLALAPEAVADARRVDEILDTALPGDLTDILGRDQARARNMLGASTPRDRAEQLLLDDVAGRLVGLARSPGLDRPLNAMPHPPGRIAPGQVQRHLIATHALGLPDAVGAERQSFAIRRSVAVFGAPVRNRLMSAAGSEEGEMPRIKLPPKRTMIRIVGEQLAVRLNRRDVRSDRLRQLPAPLFRQLRQGRGEFADRRC